MPLKIPPDPHCRMPIPDLATRLAARKEEVRRHAHAARRALPEKDALSRRIIDRLLQTDEYRSADTVLYYVDVRDEVRTQPALAAAIESEKRIAIPYCIEDGLHLFWLESMDEMEAGAYRIPEPRVELRSRPEKQLSVEQLDLVLVPGLAFDRDGGRIGYGKGYYDRLLSTARPETPLIALAYDCQIFDGVPMQSHDIYMDRVITESACYPVG